MSAKKKIPGLGETSRMLAGVVAQQAAQCAAWLSGRLALMPRMWSAHLGAEHVRRGGVASAVANAWLLEVTASGEGALSLGASDDDLRRAAAEWAVRCQDLCGVTGQLPMRSLSDVVAALVRQCEKAGVSPAKCGDDLLPTIRRMVCPRWWLRRLRASHGRRCERAAIVGGVVRRGLWPYASQDQVARRAAQKKRNDAAVQAAVLVDCDTGDAVPLADVVSGSLANPASRRAEMMTRIRGADDVAHIDGHGCEFWTLTTPSRFHAQRMVGKIAEPNQAFDGSTPKDGQRHLCRVWANARAAWKRCGLSIYGLRTAEPHHDGTPHWHIVVYGAERELYQAWWLLRTYALEDSPAEYGAVEHRFTSIQLKGGTAGASYAAKYIAKNIDGGGMAGQRDAETGRGVASMARRVDAWASTWGIRQFQFFGMPAVGVWRVLRRVPDSVGAQGAPLERARVAADEGDWCAFWLASRSGVLSLVKRAQEGLTMYGDVVAAKVVGVEEGGRRALLTMRDWVVDWTGKASRGVDFVSDSVCGFTRSSVNNCTGAENNRAAVAGFVAGLGGVKQADARAWRGNQALTLPF